MGRGDEAVREAAVLSSREQSQDSRDLVLGLYGGIGQTGSEAVLLRVLRTWLCDLCIPLGSVGGVLVSRSSRKKMSQMNPAALAPFSSPCSKQDAFLPTLREQSWGGGAQVPSSSLQLNALCGVIGQVSY